MPTDAAIREILRQRIDTDHAGVGVVVGVVDAQGRRVVSYGAPAAGADGKLDGDTLFELGSITKVFTSLLLTDAVRRGEAKLDDPVAKYLPVKAPERKGRQITLVDLATHSSGLPSLPGNFAPKNAENPYADYSAEQLFAWLPNYQLTRDIGTKYEYSNVGAGLLGQALTRKTGLSYEALATRRILRPLGMSSTVVELSPRFRARMAQGHTAALQPTSVWDIPTLAGAGALRGSANDLLTFLEAELGMRKTPLQAAMADQLAVRRPGPAANVDVALGWHVAKTPMGEIIWHNGGTGGFRTWIGFDPARKVGAVVLTNTATRTGGDDIGMHLLTGSPLAKQTPPPKSRVAISLPAEDLQKFVGVYALSPLAKITVTRNGAQLQAQVTGQAAYDVYPETPTAFFYRIVDAQITFDLDGSGTVTGLVLHQAGRNLPARREP